MGRTHDVVAVVRFLATDEGGRKSATPSGYFGCPMSLHGKLYDCRLLLREVGPISPGERATVPIKFLDWSAVAGIVKSGDVFELREGRTIAAGEIIEVARDEVGQVGSGRPEQAVEGRGHS